MSAEMDALVERVREKLEDLEAGLYQLKQVRGRYTTKDGLVSVEVDADGAMTKLRLAEAVTGLPPADVGKIVVYACKQAAMQATEQRSAVVSTLNSAFAAPPAT